METVRYYEKDGLLPAPMRTAANYRTYGSTHIDRLRFIRNCRRALSMTHEDIRALLGFMDQPPSDYGTVNQLLDELEARKKAAMSCCFAWNISLSPDAEQEEHIDRIWEMVEVDNQAALPTVLEQRLKQNLRMLVAQK